eukprot:UN28907
MADTAFTKGRHQWTFRIKQYKKPGYISFGVCEEKTNINTLLGNDAKSWGLLGDGVRWCKGVRSTSHNYGNLRIIFQNNDLVTVYLDMNTRTMFILRNGGYTSNNAIFVDLPGKVYPAVGLYDINDEVELVDYKCRMPQKFLKFRSNK